MFAKSEPTVWHTGITIFKLGLNGLLYFSWEQKSDSKLCRPDTNGLRDKVYKHRV